MSIFADLFADMMPSSISIRPLTGYSGTAPTYGTAVTYQGRISMRARNIIGRDGQTVVSRGRAWLDTVAAITVNDLVTLPDGSQPVLLAVNLQYDESGPAYTQVDFQ